jgi:Zn-dependent peptidase ImmA (M78 family)
MPDLLEAIEATARVPVAVLPLPGGIAGAYGVKMGEPYIFVNSDDWPTRQRFTLAHEFGHHELNHRGSLDLEKDLGSFSSSRPPREVQANWFAAEFLLPLDALQRWMESRAFPEEDSLETVVRLSCSFGISPRVALYRLNKGRFLTHAAKSSLEARIDASEHREMIRRLGIEELSDTLSRANQRLPRMPEPMTEYAARGYQRGLLTVDRIARTFRREPSEVRAEYESRGIRPPVDEPDY